MNLIKSLLLVALLALTPAALLAEENAPANSKTQFVGEIGVDFFSKYICSTSGGIADKNPVVQGYVKATLKTPWLDISVKSWGSGALTLDGRKHGGNEIDPFIIEIIRSVYNFQIMLGYGFYDLTPQFNGKGGDLHGLYGTISYLNKIVEPFLTVERDLPTGKSLQGGWIYRAGLKKSIKIRENISLSGDLSVGGNDGAYGFRPDFFSYARAGLSLCWSPWKNFEIIPSLNKQWRLGHHPSQGGIGRDAFWGGISFNFNHELLSF
jgi:hypothetical protein